MIEKCKVKLLLPSPVSRLVVEQQPKFNRLTVTRNDLP